MAHKNLRSMLSSPAESVLSVLSSKVAVEDKTKSLRAWAWPEALEKDDALPQKWMDRYAAVEAGKLGRGGVAYIARLFGCDPDTIRRGWVDVGFLPEDAAEGRVRKKGRSKNS